MKKEDELMLKRVSDAFNSMPFEYRKITSNSETMVRIRDLQRLRDRIIDNYNREIIYIDGKNKSYLKSIEL